MNTTRFAITALLLAALPIDLLADSSRSPFGPPEGFDQFAVYMATGTYDVNTPHPLVPGCFQGLCDPQYFHQTIMGWTPAESQLEAWSAQVRFPAMADWDVPRSSPGSGPPRGWL